MNFDDSAEEAKFRARATAWLEQNAAEYKDIDFTKIGDEEHLSFARRWQECKADAAFAVISLPEELGGGGGTQMESVIFAQEEVKHNLPSSVFFDIGLGMALPIMMTYAPEQHKRALVPKLLSGVHIWCQMFSEPSAGSDLANLRTRAVRDGDSWVVNGQKIWTSQGHHADYGILIVRSDPEQPKHRGLTFFFVDMKSRGIEVRPIKQMSGDSDFNEVYFTNVRIPDDQRLGEPEQGWSVALTTLMYERQVAGERSLGLIEFDDMLDFISTLQLEDGPAIDDGMVREKLCEWYLKAEGLRFSLYRRLTALSGGGVPGPEAAMGKLVEASGALDAARFCTDLMDLSGGLGAAAVEPKLAPHVRTVLFAPGMRVAGGTDEILRNTIAERVLGLPPEIRTDKAVPFKDLKN